MDSPNIDVTGGIPSEIYVRMGRDGCSDSIFEYVYRLLAKLTLLRAENKKLRETLETICGPYAPRLRVCKRIARAALAPGEE